MAPTSDPLLLLRSITTILTNTPEPSLPAHIPSIASLLYASPLLDAAIAISTDASQRSRQEDAAVLVNKFKTRVAALLQSRVSQAKWCGVVLVKVAVESSFEALAAYGAVWVKLVCNLVTRPEPPTTTVMVIRTLARVFTHLSVDKPTLTREVVTPHLPAFFTGMLAALDAGEARVVAAALEALRDVVAAHPTTFRPFVNKARTAILQLLSAGASSEDEERLAREVYVTLHLCASNSSKRAAGQVVEGGVVSKINAVAGEWNMLLTAVLDGAHNTLDAVFAPVIEEYDYRHQHRQFSGAALALAPAEDLPERLLLLLRLLGTFFTTPTTAQPQIPIAQIIDLTSRIFAITVASAQHNPAIERTQREMLLTLLPTIHSTTLDLLTTITTRLQSSLLPFIPALLDQAAYLVAEESWSSNVRIAAYTLTSALLHLAGPALSKTSLDTLHPLLTQTCLDLLPPPTAKSSHADTLLQNSTTTPAAPFLPPTLHPTASHLLATSLHKLPTPHLRADLRARLERTAILTSNKPALLAAVLFPAAHARTGTIPHLVGAGVDLATEALVRPRMPVVWTGPSRADVRRELEEQREAAEHDAEADSDTEMETSRKRARTEEEPAPAPAAAAPTPATSFFFSSARAPAPGISPEKSTPYPALPAVTGTVAYPVAYPALVKTAATTIVPAAAAANAGESPVKPDGAVQQLRKEVRQAEDEDEEEEEGSDVDMFEPPVIDMGGDSSDSDDE